MVAHGEALAPGSRQEAPTKAHQFQPPGCWGLVLSWPCRLSDNGCARILIAGKRNDRVDAIAGRRTVPGGAAGLQNQSGGRKVLGGFDSLPSPPLTVD